MISGNVDSWFCSGSLFFEFCRISDFFAMRKRTATNRSGPYPQELPPAKSGGKKNSDGTKPLLLFVFVTWYYFSYRDDTNASTQQQLFVTVSSHDHPFYPNQKKTHAHTIKGSPSLSPLSGSTPLSSQITFSNTTENKQNIYCNIPSCTITKLATH